MNAVEGIIKNHFAFSNAYDNSFASLFSKDFQVAPAIATAFNDSIVTEAAIATEAFESSLKSMHAMTMGNVASKFAEGFTKGAYGNINKSVENLIHGLSSERIKAVENAKVLYTDSISTAVSSAVALHKSLGINGLESAKYTDFDIPQVSINRGKNPASVNAALSIRDSLNEFVENPYLAPAPGESIQEIKNIEEQRFQSTSNFEDTILSEILEHVNDLSLKAYLISLDRANNITINLERTYNDVVDTVIIFENNKHVKFVKSVLYYILLEENCNSF